MGHTSTRMLPIHANKNTQESPPQTSIKNILIGVLVAYVVTDFLISSLAKRKHPTLVERVLSGLDEQSVLMALVIGILIGIISWYTAKKY